MISAPFAGTKATTLVDVTITYAENGFDLAVSSGFKCMQESAHLPDLDPGRHIRTKCHLPGRYRSGDVRRPDKAGVWVIDTSE